MIFKKRKETIPKKWLKTNLRVQIAPSNPYTALIVKKSMTQKYIISVADISLISNNTKKEEYEDATHI